MEKELQAIGLSESETKVYVALLELGGATVSEIAKRARVNRTSVYDILTRLIETGLVTRAAGEKKQSYQAEPPSKLPLILEERAVKAADQAKAAKRLVGKLNLLAKSKMIHPQIRLFEGVTGIKELYDDTLLTKESIRSFQSADSMVAFDPKYFQEYFARRTKKNIFIKAILNDTVSAREYQQHDPELCRELRIVPHEMMDIKPEVYVYENKVAFFSLAERFAVLVESADIAYALKKLYDLAWEKAKEYNERKPVEPAAPQSRRDAKIP